MILVRTSLKLSYLCTNVASLCINRCLVTFATTHVHVRLCKTQEAHAVASSIQAHLMTAHPAIASYDVYKLFPFPYRREAACCCLGIDICMYRQVKYLDVHVRYLHRRVTEPLAVRQLYYMDGNDRELKQLEEKQTLFPFHLSHWWR
jgi:hypothetical protein